MIDGLLDELMDYRLVLICMTDGWMVYLVSVGLMDEVSGLVVRVVDLTGQHPLSHLSRVQVAILGKWTRKDTRSTLHVKILLCQQQSHE